MIAISMAELQKLAMALPKCLICMPDTAGCSFIIDQQGEKVGDINWQIPQITIYDDYQYINEVIEALGKEKFQTREIKKELENG